MIARYLAEKGATLGVSLPEILTGPTSSHLVRLHRVRDHQVSENEQIQDCIGSLLPCQSQMYQFFCSKGRLESVTGSWLDFLLAHSESIHSLAPGGNHFRTIAEKP